MPPKGASEAGRANTPEPTMLPTTRAVHAHRPSDFAVALTGPVPKPRGARGARGSRERSRAPRSRGAARGGMELDRPEGLGDERPLLAAHDPRQVGERADRRR